MENAAYHIMPATWRDLGPLRKIEQECFGEDAWPLIDLVGVLTFAGIIRLKAMVGEEMAGFIAGDGDRKKEVGWITTVGVLVVYRKTGIGRALLDACEQQLPNKVIQLTVRQSNHSAIHMYQQAGYHQIEIWEKYYNGGEAGIVMQKIKS
jgi:ribosomal protein S18 acetylase RimI-like enzyme